MQAQVVVEFLPGHAAGAADRLGDRARRIEVQWQGLEQRGEFVGLIRRRTGQRLAQQGRACPGESELAPQVLAERAAAACLRQLRRHRRQRNAGQQIDFDVQPAAAAGGTQRLAQRIEQRAFETVVGDQQLTLTPRTLAADPQGDRLQWLAGEPFAEVLTPATFVTDVGRQQVVHRNAGLAQSRHPGAIGAQHRPAGAAQGKDLPIGGDHTFALGRGEAQRAILPAGETVMHVQPQAPLAQPAQPAAQQRRGLEVGGKHPP
jgi:hypothetical protein